MCSQDTTRLMPRRKSDAHLVEHLLSLANALQVELLTDAGFDPKPEYDGTVCKDCGASTEDDGDRYCMTCMPVCVECEKATNSPNQDGQCDDCVDAAWARRSVKPASWNGNSMVAP